MAEGEIAETTGLSARSRQARDGALDQALGRLADGAIDRPDTPDLHVTAVRRLPAIAARYAPFPSALDARLVRALGSRGVSQLYTHQAEAIGHALDGRNVVVITPTASGKTLCYNAPVLNAVLQDPSSRALYLFPTKALAQDQLAELQALCETLDQTTAEKIGVFTYDGDTPQDARRTIRSRAHLVLSNPDMLHSGILPHHPRWAKLFENLRFIVIDELHAYRGVFGSHLCNVLRRLRRICRHYGSNPVFVCSSATIANARELAERLTEESFDLVEQNGAPRGEKFFVFVNPPVVNQQLGIRRSYLSETRRIAAEFLKRNLQLIVFAQSRLSTEILTTYLKDDFEGLPGQPEKIRGYRGGYLPLRRREIEKGLREGAVRAVVSTNALELGIDIGALDVSVMAGYPGTIASTWQRAGRAGRRASRSAAVMVASSAPIDQFVVRHPSYFFDASPERALIDPDNLHILVDHIKCAAFELPFTPAEQFGRHDLQEILGLLAEQGLVHDAGQQYTWTSESYPADAVSLRSISSDNFVIVDTTREPRVIGETDFTSGPSTLHPKAIYIVEGQLYQVEKLDFEGRKAFVREIDCDYYTDAITYDRVTILDTFAHAGSSPASHGETHVVSRVVGFKKIKFYTNENVGSGELESARAADAHDGVLADRAGAGLGAPAVRAGRSPRRRRRAGIRDASGGAAPADVRSPRHRHLHRHGRRGRRRRRRRGSENLHLRQLPGRDRLQRAAVPHARRARRRDAPADRGVRVRERVSHLRRTGGEHRAAGEVRGAPDPGSADRPPPGRLTEMESSKLAERLRGILHAPGPAVAAPPAAPLPAGASIEPALGGQWRETPAGACFVVERRFEPDAAHGRDRIGDLAARLDASAGEAPLVAGGAPARPPFLFFDLETTGLSGGAGTHAFLVGCAGFGQDGAFLVRQYVMPRYADERSMLMTVAGELERAGALVSFNGKSFDAPVLETRYLFHRLEWVGAGRPHVDVLHPARLFWGNGVARSFQGRAGGAESPALQRQGCSLGALEQDVLGARRHGDVPGFEIPARYFQFVRTGDARPLAAVLEHNRLDLLSLAGLTARLLHLVGAGHEEARDRREALALGRVYARAGFDGRARAAFACAAEGIEGGPIRIEALRALALAWRRERRFDEAAACWRRLLDERRCPPHVAREATEALAIHHEHRVRDLASAKAFALRTLEAEARPGWTDAARHRLARIERKMGFLE